MNYSPAEIDRLVREVVRRLSEAAPTAAVSAPVVAASSAGRASSQFASPNASDVWRPSDKVITASTLDARPAAARVLAVRRGTVVTPAAKDRLRQLKIELRWESPTAVAANTTPTTQAAGKAYVHATPNSLVGTPLGKLVTTPGWQAETLVPASLPQAAAELAAVLANSRHVGILVTTERDLALCLANRHASIRAVAAGDKGAVAAAIREWGANLLVVDPRRTSVPTIKQWIDAFLRPGPRQCSAPWNSHLGS